MLPVNRLRDSHKEKSKIQVDIEIENKLMLMENKRLSAELLFIFDLIFDVVSPSMLPDSGNETITADSKERKLAVERFRRYFRGKLNVIPLKEALESLMERGILIKREVKEDIDAEKFNPEKLEINKLFLNGYRKYTFELGIEMRDAYPNIGKIDNQEIPLKSIKKFSCEAELFTTYAKMIRHDVEKHNHIISLIKWSVENQTAFTNMNIESFVLGRIWESIEEFKNGGGIGYSSISEEMTQYV